MAAMADYGWCRRAQRNYIGAAASIARFDEGRCVRELKGKIA
jgi:hypothetical protein